MNYENPQRAVYEYQDPATLNQAAPVQDTWYPILGTLTEAENNVRVYGIGVGVEDADETLEVQGIVDGVTIPASLAVNVAHSTTVTVLRQFNAVSRSVGLRCLPALTQAYLPSFLFDGRSVQIQVRKTTAGGAGNLIGVVCWGVLKNI